MYFRLQPAFFILILLFATACTKSNSDETLPATPPTPSVTDSAQVIVDQAIATHGGAVLRHAVVAFDFRGKHFKITRRDGLFTYERTYSDSTGDVHEVLNNDGIYREVNGERVTLTEAQTNSLLTTLNSVPYFALLPFNLGDPGVHKRYLGETTVNGEPYHEVEVTFSPENGGSDYEDRFVYWFHRDRHTMDYLAYDYHRDETGTRFRQAFNPRIINGVRFADYHNFVSDSLPRPDMPIERYDTFFESGAVKLFSEIILDSVTVQPLSP